MPEKPSYKELERLVAEQRRIIRALMESEERLRFLSILFDDSNDAITVQDFHGNILEWNRGAEKLYGWTREQALQMNISRIIPPDRSVEALSLVKDIAMQKRIDSFETKRISADGRILDILFTATALSDDHGKAYGMATTERHITAKKQAEREKITMIKELQKALAEVKTLRGIVPICMFCKQIRNDRGFWEQVEVYVHNHTEANFSHGICPKCMKERYPKVYQKQLLLEGPKTVNRGKA